MCKIARYVVWGCLNPEMSAVSNYGFWRFGPFLKPSLIDALRIESDET